MDSDFFGTQGQTAIQNQDIGAEHFQSQDNAPDEEFQFQQPNKYVAIEFAQQQSYSGVATDVEAIRRIQEEEVKVQDRLREKANTEYEEKQKRKQEGKRQLQEFLAKKEKQTKSRKEENIEKEKQILARNAKLSEEAGWKKVAANVPLKQGEHKGAKDTTRMRQSIINKRNDETA